MTFNVMYSPSYQVPVLYILPSHSLNSISSLYAHLVPWGLRPSLESTGVMGGITMGNHPSTDVPCFFLHPCQTSQAMTEVCGESGATLDCYLLKWLGVVGAAVGLFVPMDLAKIVLGSEST